MQIRKSPRLNPNWCYMDLHIETLLFFFSLRWSKTCSKQLHSHKDRFHTSLTFHEYHLNISPDVTSALMLANKISHSRDKIWTHFLLKWTLKKWFLCWQIWHGIEWKCFKTWLSQLNAPALTCSRLLLTAPSTTVYIFVFIKRKKIQRQRSLKRDKFTSG